MWEILLSLLLLFSSVGIVWAQSVGDLYAKSVQVGSDYRQKYSAFQVARDQNIQYQTASTRLAALSATKDVLVSRNAWQIAYLTYLHAYLGQAAIGSDVETEITTLNAMTSTLQSGDTVDLVNQSSSDWEGRLPTTDKLTQAATVQIASTKLADLQNQLQAFVNASQSQDTTTLGLIKQKLQSSIDLRMQVDQSIANYNTYSWDPNTISNQLTQSKQLLFEASTLLEQIK